MGQAGKSVLFINGVGDLENMGRLNFRDTIQIVDFYHGAVHAGQVMEALPGNKEHPEYKSRRNRWVRRILGNSVENLAKEKTGRNVIMSRAVIRFTKMKMCCSGGSHPNFYGFFTFDNRY